MGEEPKCEKEVLEKDCKGGTGQSEALESSKGKWPGDRQGETEGSWLLSVKEMRTSKNGSWACRIVLIRLLSPFSLRQLHSGCCLGILSLLRTSLKLPEVLFVETCLWFWFCVSRLHNDRVTHGAFSEQWHRALSPLPHQLPGLPGPVCHVTSQRKTYCQESGWIFVIQDMYKGTQCLGPWTLWELKTWNKTKSIRIANTLKNQRPKLMFISTYVSHWQSKNIVFLLERKIKHSLSHSMFTGPLPPLSSLQICTYS